jgi:hypothetical protein
MKSILPALRTPRILIAGAAFGLSFSLMALTKVSILWPTGKKQIFKNIEMNQIVKIREGDPAARPVALNRLNLSTGGGRHVRP